MARRVEGHGGKGGSWRAEREPEGRGRPQRVEKAPKVLHRVKEILGYGRFGHGSQEALQRPVGGETPGDSLLLEPFVCFPFCFSVTQSCQTL